jgi:hypothetical protein
VVQEGSALTRDLVGGSSVQILPRESRELEISSMIAFTNATGPGAYYYRSVIATNAVCFVFPFQEFRVFPHSLTEDVRSFGVGETADVPR